MKQDKLTDGRTQVTMNRHGAQGKTRLNTRKGNHRKRDSWAGEAETQGQQMNTIRQSDTGGKTQEGRQDTGRTELQNKTLDKTDKTKIVT